MFDSYKSLRFKKKVLVMPWKNKLKSIDYKEKMESQGNQGNLESLEEVFLECKCQNRNLKNIHFQLKSKVETVEKDKMAALVRMELMERIAKDNMLKNVRNNI